MQCVLMGIILKAHDPFVNFKDILSSRSYSVGSFMHIFIHVHIYLAELNLNVLNGI